MSKKKSKILYTDDKYHLLTTVSYHGNNDFQDHIAFLIIRTEIYYKTM